MVSSVSHSDAISPPRRAPRRRSTPAKEIPLRPWFKAAPRGLPSGATTMVCMGDERVHSTCIGGRSAQTASVLSSVQPQGIQDCGPSRLPDARRNAAVRHPGQGRRLCTTSTKECAEERNDERQVIPCAAHWGMLLPPRTSVKSLPEIRCCIGIFQPACLPPSPTALDQAIAGQIVCEKPLSAGRQEGAGGRRAG